MLSPAPAQTRLDSARCHDDIYIVIAFNLYGFILKIDSENGVYDTAPIDGPYADQYFVLKIEINAMLPNGDAGGLRGWSCLHGW